MTYQIKISKWLLNHEIRYKMTVFSVQGDFSEMMDRDKLRIIQVFIAYLYQRGDLGFLCSIFPALDNIPLLQISQ